MAAALIVKRTFLEVSLDDENSASRRERSFSEGAVPLERVMCKTESPLQDDDSSASTTEVESSLESLEDGYVSSEDSEASFSDCTDVQPSPSSSTGPPGQWSHAQQNCPAMPMTWYLVPVGSPVQTRDVQKQPKAIRSGAAKKRKSKTQQSIAGQNTECDRTTVIIRSLSDDFTMPALLEMLDSKGFKGLYDFVYLPRDFKTSKSLGYAIVNMQAPRHAMDVVLCFSDHNTSFSDSHRGGLMMLIQRYRDSPMMHPEVPDGYKPAVFVSGHRVAFPPPNNNFAKLEVEKILKQVCEQRED